MQEHPQTPPRRIPGKAKGSPHFERIAKMVKDIPGRSDFDQAPPPTPALADEPEDETFTSDEDQLSIYSKLSLDKDSSDVVAGTATAEQVRNLTGFLKEANNRDIDTSQSRGLINQGKGTKDLRALDTTKKRAIKKLETPLKRTLKKVSKPRGK